MSVWCAKFAQGNFEVLGVGEGRGSLLESTPQSNEHKLDVQHDIRSSQLTRLADGGPTAKLDEKLRGFLSILLEMRPPLPERRRTRGRCKRVATQVACISLHATKEIDDSKCAQKTSGVIPYSLQTLFHICETLCRLSRRCVQLVLAVV